MAKPWCSSTLIWWWSIWAWSWALPSNCATSSTSFVSASSAPSAQVTLRQPSSAQVVLHQRKSLSDKLRQRKYLSQRKPLSEPFKRSATPDLPVQWTFLDHFYSHVVGCQPNTPWLWLWCPHYCSLCPVYDCSPVYECELWGCLTVLQCMNVSWREAVKLSSTEMPTTMIWS